MPFPFAVPDDQRNELVTKMLNYITRAQEENVRLKERISILEEEIHRLKGLNGKPDIKPNTPPKDSGSAGDNQPTDGSESDHQKRDTGKPDERTRKKRKKPPKPKDPTCKRVAPESIPEGAVFKGFSTYDVQELSFEVNFLRYELEHWTTPDGQSLHGRLPKAMQGYHFGPNLRCYVLHQHHACAVTEQQLLESLWDWGVSISAGELSNLLTLNHDDFHEEKDGLLATGLLHCGYLQVDDTGARHKGQNGYCTFIGNPQFAWFGSTGSKSRENFLTLLHCPWPTHVLNEHAMDFLEEHKFPAKWRLVFQACLGVHFLSLDSWHAFLNDCGLKGPILRKKASEAMLYGSLIAHGVRPDLPIHSDGAGQFDVFTRSGCWLHACRPIERVIPVNNEQVEEQYQLLCQFWELYRDLKAFKENPDQDFAHKIRSSFRQLVQVKVECSGLREALGNLAVKEPELLAVLDDPGLPLHNNLSESQIREHVKRRKISGGTRSESGRQARDTFASLKKMCRLHGISFWSYLQDRMHGYDLIPRLSEFIKQAVYGDMDDSFAKAF